jgi:GT2 family glycosyltransferase
VPRVSVIVPIFNSIAHLPAFFESLAVALPKASQVVVVDDASTEPVLNAIPELPDANVARLRNETNLGNAGAVNRGFSVVTGDIVIQLNVDVILDPNCLVAMIELIDRHTTDVGIVGSKLIYPTTGRTQSVGMAFGSHSKRHVFRHLPKDHPLCLPTRELQIVTGATAAMTRRALELLGPLDEQLYNHNSDLDHCLRAVHYGLRNFMCAKSVAYHWRNRSGTVRYARVDAAEAAFWSKWGGRYSVDLGTFIDEGLDHAIAVRPELETTPFGVLDLSRGADQTIAIERLEARWPGIGHRIRDFRQMNNASTCLWLPTLLPHWMINDPTPFLYLVDSHEELDENSMWFERRRQVVVEELIVDLSATVVTSSELCEFLLGDSDKISVEDVVDVVDP